MDAQVNFRYIVSTSHVVMIQSDIVIYITSDK